MYLAKKKSRKISSELWASSVAGWWSEQVKLNTRGKGRVERVSGEKGISNYEDHYCKTDMQRLIMLL